MLNIREAMLLKSKIAKSDPVFLMKQTDIATIIKEKE